MPFTSIGQTPTSTTSSIGTNISTNIGTVTTTTTSSNGDLLTQGGYREDDPTDNYGANLWAGEDGNETLTTNFTDSAGEPVLATNLKINFSDLNSSSGGYTEKFYLVINGEQVTLTGTTTTLADGTVITFSNNADNDYQLTADGGITAITGRSTGVADGGTLKVGEVGSLTITSPDGISSIGIAYSETDNDWFSNPNGFLYDIQVNDETFLTAPPCFAAGTMIETDQGPVPVECLKEGQLVMTRDNGLQEIRWIGSRKVTAKTLAAKEELRPIRIRRHALGTNIPSADLIVSPQHRILVRSKIAQRMFDTDEILVAAKQLCQLDGIDIAHDLPEVEYFHFLFDQHEVVISNGAETESLYTGPQALKSVGPAALEEIFTLFPQLKDRDYTPSPARTLASGRMGRKLAVRHKQNAKALVTARH